nr:ribonuclease H-like domain-containing protein [Tanacetum cinerariifolium]
MRTKPGLDTFSFDDLFNNLRVFERDVKEGLHKGYDRYYCIIINNLRVFERDVKDYDDLEQINDDDMEEMDLKWQGILLETAELKGTKTAEEEMLGTMETKLETMQIGSDNEVKSCSKAYEESYARLKKLYDDQRDKLGDASVEITVYTLALKKVEAQLLCHRQNQLAYEQNIRFMKKDLDDKNNMLAYHKKLLAEALKEKEDLETKFENWQNSSNILSKLLNTQMSTNDNFGLGYGDYRYGSILSYKNEVLQIPPLMTRNYMPYRPDVEINYSKFTYGPKQTSADKSDSKPSEYASCESDSSVKTSTSMPQPVVNASKVVCKPKVWIDAPIIEEHKSDSDNDSVSNVKEDKEKPSCAFTDSLKHVKTSRENIKETGTTSHSPKIEKQDRNGHTRKDLGYAFTRKACFDDPHRALKDKGIIDSGCFRHMTGNKAHLVDYQEFKGGFVAFGGSNGRIAGKGKIKAGRLDFEDIYFVEELKHCNLFSTSQMCDKKNKVLFTDTDCLVLSFDFKLPDENQVLKIPRQHNMYSFNLKNIDPSGDLACLFAKASIDESNKWHRRLGHVNFKNLN